jgi:putative ABC transport system ATP-binding protein
MSENIILEAIDISKTYHSSEVAVEALKPCTVSFSEGEFTAIIGKSGSGKTTLLHLLGTQDVPDQGEILLSGKSILNLSDNALARVRRRKIGFVYQDYSLFPEYTAYENIILPIRLDERREDPEEIMGIMETLGITHCRDKFPGEMSGGEQQRCAIARALAIKPAVILADEPTGNLDEKNSQEIMKLLYEINAMGTTVLVITHSRNIVEASGKRVISMEKGVIRSDTGAPFSDPPVETVPWETEETVKGGAV